jgi:hypothetical protein
MFQSVFNLVLSISKTHLIAKLETFPHLRRARAGFGWGRGAVRPPRNMSSLGRLMKDICIRTFVKGGEISSGIEVIGYN